MKKLIALVALAGLLCLGGSAMANIGAADVVPAATLLIPRFEVDLENTDGITTLFSVNNASQESVIAHVTLWTEWWIPIIDFDVYLTGYDVQTLNVRDILNGVLPRTGRSNAFPPSGPYSAPHPSATAFENLGCGTGALGSPPNYSPLAASFVALIQQAFSGQPIDLLGGDCASFNAETNLARGYITVDSVNICNQAFPSNDNYFVNGGDGIANNNNVLWGDFFLVDPSEDFAQGFVAVHIEADSLALDANIPSCDALIAPNPVDDGVARNGFPYTFYCSLTQYYDAGADNRESLASVYGTRYLEGGAFTGGTSLIGWRDPLLGEFPTIPCRTAGGTRLVPFFMEQEQIVRFDEEENVVIPGGPSLPEAEDDEFPFPFCTNRAEVGVDISVDADFGWLYLNLNDAGTETLLPDTPDFFTYNQAYVATVLDASGRFSVGYEAVQFNNLNYTYDGNRDPELMQYGPNPNAPTLTDVPILFQPFGF